MNNVNQLGINGTNTLLMLNERDLENVVERVVMTFFDKITKEMDSRKSDELLLTEDEVKAKLNVGHTTLWRWHERGYLCHVKIGKRCLWRKSDIDELTLHR